MAPIFARFKTLDFQFKFPAGTSRGILLHKNSSFLILEKDGFTGIGECSTIPNLSIDSEHFYHDKLVEICKLLNAGVDPDSIDLSAFPSLSFGLEAALFDLKSHGTKVLFQNLFTRQMKLKK